jgi:hypothetical protein
MPVLSGWLWWVYNYQTLATGVLAVVAAIVTALAVRNQTNNQRKIAEEAARHRTKAAIAALIAEVKGDETSFDKDKKWGHCIRTSRLRAESRIHTSVSC